MPYLIEPQTAPRTFHHGQAQKLLESHPRGSAPSLVALTLAIIADTGLRSEEMLKLESHDIDLDGCILRVRLGKAAKIEWFLSPFLYGRRLYLYMKGMTGPMFATRTRTVWSYRNSLRDLKLFCKGLGISGPKGLITHDPS